MTFLNSELDTNLKELPEKVADQLIKWRQASLEREKLEALLYLRFKGEDPERSATTLKAMVNADADRYKVCLNEATQEAEYERLYETLMSNKKLADLRTAY